MKNKLVVEKLKERDVCVMEVLEWQQTKEEDYDFIEIKAKCLYKNLHIIVDGNIKLKYYYNEKINIMSISYSW